MTTNVILRRYQDEQYILEEKMTSINESTTNVLIKNLKAGVNASTVVSRYAQATLTAVPILPDSPSWVEPIKLNLITAQEYASTWLKIICPCLCRTIPKSIIDYSGLFQSISSEILDILQKLQSSNALPTQQQRNRIGVLFDELSSHIKNQQTLLITLQNKINAYSMNIKSAQDTLAEDLGNVSEKFVDAKKWITNIKTCMEEDFLDSTVLGPCIAIVEVNTDISVKVQGSGADPSIITLLFATAILKNQTTNLTPAELAVQTMLDNWATLKVKNEAVIDDLENAKDDEYRRILIKVDLQTAQEQWLQLSGFAQKLLK